MCNRSTRGFGTAAAVGVVFWSVGAWAALQTPADALAAANAAGWLVPDAALEEMSPLTPTAAVIKKGKALYSSACQKCHGATGRGDGPYGDPEHRPADLTASTTADGVMFYKVWNGRKAPAMPPFKTTLTREEVWTVIEYARSLRASDAR
jgi:mono/diheme cytochrome c family protein